MKQLFILLIVITSLSVNAQFRLLKDIASGNNHGVGLSLIANNNSDGNLYFMGSENQFSFFVWKTDGVTTTNVLGSDVLKGVNNIYFGDDVTYIKDIDNGLKLKLTDGTPQGTRTLDPFTNQSMGDVYHMGDKAVVMGNSINVFTTDGTNAGSFKIGELPEATLNTVVTTNDSLAVIYHKAFNQKFTPYIVHNNGQSLSTLIDFLKPIAEFEFIGASFVFENFIAFSGSLNGSNKNMLYNLTTKELTDFEFVGEFFSAIPLGDNIIVLSRTEAFSFDKNTLAVETIADEVFGFTTWTVYDDKVYFIGKVNGGGFQYIETDGTTAGTRGLEGTNVSLTSFNPRQAILDDKMYYIQDNGSSADNDINVYDLITDEITSLGIISIKTLGIVFSQGIFAVNDKIVLSRYTSDLGHEMYVYDETLNLEGITPKSNTNLLKNTMVSNTLMLQNTELVNNIRITSNNGQIMKDWYNQDRLEQLDINFLPSGIYYLNYIEEGVTRSERFIKI